MNLALTSGNRKDSGSTSKSHFQHTVCLVDWWLIKADNDFQGRRLAVAGLARENKAVRAFSSAPILKRYELSNLETADGICVIIDGMLNKDQTLENGFPSNVCEHFSFGFPSYWEECAKMFIDEETPFVDISVTTPVKEKVSSPKSKAMRGKQTRGDAPRMITRSCSKINSEKKIPQREKEKLPGASPQSLSFKRSRSGRLLMPKLKFWHNQRAIYEADRTVVRVVDDTQLEQPTRSTTKRSGSGSTSGKKRQP